jgi:hypothetical protein
MSDEAPKPLEVSETGPYAEMIQRPLPEGRLLVFVPSLAAMLTRAEQLKGADLTREEVLRIRNVCTVLVTEPQAAQAIEEQRGYTDLDMDDPWESWLRLQNRAEHDGLS